MIAGAPICAPDDPVSAAAALMSRPTPCVLVVAGDRLVGVLNDHDLIRLVAAGQPLAELTVGAVALPAVSVRRAELAGPEQALALLIRHQVPQIVVVDDTGRPIGLITQASLGNKPAQPPTEQAADAPPNPCDSSPYAHTYTQSLIDILHAARDIIASADPAGRITFMNRTGRELLGIPDQTRIEATLIGDYHPPEVARHILHAAIPQAVAAGFWEGETIFRHRDGHAIPTWQVIVAHYHPDGTLSHLSSIARDLTERRLEEQRLREREERLRLALQAAKQGLYDLDLHTGEAIVTPEYATMLGYDPATFVETNARWIERLHPDDAEPTGAAFRDYIAGKTAEYSVEFRQRTATGGWKWILSLGKIVAWDSDGRPQRMLGTHTDITARKAVERTLLDLNHALEQRVAARTAALQASEAQLRKSEAHLIAAQRIALLGSWEFELATQAITWSIETYRIFQRDQQLGPPTFDELHGYFHPDDREPHRRTVAQALSDGQPYTIELRVIRADGTMRYLQARGEPVFEAEGRLARLVGTIHDITERRRADEQIRSLADRLSLAVKSAAIGIWDWEIAPDILSWDQRMYELYGIAPAHFTRAYDAWAGGLHPDDRAEAEAAITMALRGEREFDTMFRVIHPDGAIRVIKAYGLVQRDANGAPTRMIGVNFDITEQKQAELRLQQTSAQLAQSNHELEAFAYSVSHDLRAPLRAIDGFSQALVEDYHDQLDEMAQIYVKRIRAGVQRMSTLIDDLLRLSQVSRAEMRYSHFSLSGQVQQIVAGLRESQPERQVTVSIAPDVWIWADQSLMAIATGNLLENAWKFTSHHAQATITFSAERIDGQVVYSVRDDGAGFDPAYRHKLFGVFQRLHDTNEFPGTGIGLATVQRVINRHGGTIWAEGAVEQGASFFFTLPDKPYARGATRP